MSKTWNLGKQWYNKGITSKVAGRTEFCTQDSYIDCMHEQILDTQCSWL
jgi:hypothetical protein